MPARQQRYPQVLVDALHDPHVVVGIDDPERQLDQVRSQGEVDVDPHQPAALLVGQLPDIRLGPLGYAEQFRQRRRQRLGLQQVLVQKVREDHAKRQADEALREVDGVVVDQMGAGAHPVFDTALVHPELQHPPGDTGHGYRHAVEGRRVAVDEEAADHVRADAAKQKGDSADQLRPSAQKCHREHGGNHGHDGNVEQVHGPGESRRHPPGQRTDRRDQRHEERRVLELIAAAADQVRDFVVGPTVRIPPAPQQLRSDVRPRPEQEPYNVSEAAVVLAHAAVPFRGESSPPGTSATPWTGPSSLRNRRPASVDGHAGDSTRLCHRDTCRRNAVDCGR